MLMEMNYGRKKGCTMKKKLIVLIVMSMMAVLLAACGNDSEGADSRKETTLEDTPLLA